MAGVTSPDDAAPQRNGAVGVADDGEAPLRVRRASLFAGLAIFALVLAAPRPADLSVEAWRLAAVTALMVVWWIGEALPIGATSLVPLVLLPVLGVRSTSEAASSYGDPIVFLFLGAFLIALAMERQGLHRRIGLALVAAIGGEPHRLVLGFLVATVAVSMWINNTAAALMMLPVAVSVVEHVCADACLDGKSGVDATQRARRSLGAAVMLGIAYGASLGGMGTLVGTAPNLVFIGQLKSLHPDHPPIAFLRWMLLGIPLVVSLTALVYPALLRLAPETPLSRFRFATGGGSTLRSERARLGPMSAAERLVLGGFATAVLLWVTRAPLDVGAVHVPGWSEWLPRPPFAHDATVAIAIGLALLALRARGGAAVAFERAPLLDWRTVETRVPWGVLLLMGGGFALAAAFETTGLAAALGGRLRGLAGVPLPLLVLAIVTLTTLLSEIASNTATATLLMPLLSATANALGLSPLALMAPATLAASCGFMLPVATPPNAIAFATGWVSVAAMARTGLFLDIAGIALITLICQWLVPGVLGG